MFETTNKVLDKNNGLWSTIPAFADAVSRAETGTQAVREKSGEQVTGGEAATKVAARTDLEDQAMMIADQLAALAAKTGDHDLAAKVDVNKSQLDRMADSDLLKATGRIATAAADHSTVLASDYAITAAELTALGAAITKFEGMKTAPRNAVVDRKVATLALPEAVNYVRGIYRNELDKLMTRFKKSAPAFYSAYTAARVIVNHAATHAAKKPVAADTPAAPK